MAPAVVSLTCTFGATVDGCYAVQVCDATKLNVYSKV